MLLAMALIAVFAVVTVSIAKFGDVTFLQQQRTEKTANADSVIEGAAAYSVADANRQDWSCFGFPSGSVTMTDGTMVGYSTKACVPTAFTNRFAKLPCSLCALRPPGGANPITGAGDYGIYDSKVPIALADPGGAIISNSSVTVQSTNCALVFAAAGGVRYWQSASAPSHSAGSTFGTTNATGKADGVTTKNGTTISSASLFSGSANYSSPTPYAITDSECDLSSATSTTVQTENNGAGTASISPKASKNSDNMDVFTVALPQAPTPMSTPLPDPLSSLSSPFEAGYLAGLANNGSVSSNGGIIKPGVYGSISIAGNSTTYLDPGVYAVTGVFSVSGSVTTKVYVNCGTDLAPAACTGPQAAGQPGVLLYFLCGTSAAPVECTNPTTAAGSFQTSGSGTIDLRSDLRSLAPGYTGVPDPYANMAVFYDRNDENAFSVSGNGEYVFSGATYLPSGEFALAGNGATAGINGPIIAWTISLQDSGNSTSALALSGLGAGPASCITFNNGLRTSLRPGAADGAVTAGSTTITSPSLFTGTANFVGDVVNDSQGRIPSDATILAENSVTHQATLSESPTSTGLLDTFTLSVLTSHDAVQSSIASSGVSPGSGCTGGAQIVDLNYLP